MKVCDMLYEKLPYNVYSFEISKKLNEWAFNLIVLLMFLIRLIRDFRIHNYENPLIHSIKKFDWIIINSNGIFN